MHRRTGTQRVTSIRAWPGHVANPCHRLPMGTKGHLAFMAKCLDLGNRCRISARWVMFPPCERLPKSKTSSSLSPVLHHQAVKSAKVLRSHEITGNARNQKKQPPIWNNTNNMSAIGMHAQHEYAQGGATYVTSPSRNAFVRPCMESRALVEQDGCS